MSTVSIQKRSENIRRIYAEYSKKLVALQKKHHDEISQILRAFEERRIEEIRKTLMQQ